VRISLGHIHGLGQADTVVTNPAIIAEWQAQTDKTNPNSIVDENTVANEPTCQGLIFGSTPYNICMEPATGGSPADVAAALGVSVAALPAYVAQTNASNPFATPSILAAAAANPNSHGSDLVTPSTGVALLAPPTSSVSTTTSVTQPTQQQISAATNSTPVNLSPVTVPVSSAPSSWLTQTSIDSIPNWALLAGGGLLLFLLFGGSK
jgi:hypothetical protein